MVNHQVVLKVEFLQYMEEISADIAIPDGALQSLYFTYRGNGSPIWLLLPWE